MVIIKRGQIEDFNNFGSLLKRSCIWSYSISVQRRGEQS